MNRKYWHSHPKKNREFNIELIQTLLNQGCTIDHTAEMMTESPQGIWQWRKRIIALIEQGKVIA